MVKLIVYGIFFCSSIHIFCEKQKDIPYFYGLLRKEHEDFSLPKYFDKHQEHKKLPLSWSQKGFLVAMPIIPATLGIILHDYSSINASLAVSLGAKNKMGNIPKPLWGDVEYSEELKEWRMVPSAVGTTVFSSLAFASLGAMWQLYKYKNSSLSFREKVLKISKGLLIGGISGAAIGYGVYHLPVTQRLIIASRDQWNRKKAEFNLQQISYKTIVKPRASNYKESLYFSVKNNKNVGAIIDEIIGTKKVLPAQKISHARYIIKEFEKMAKDSSYWSNEKTIYFDVIKQLNDKINQIIQEQKDIIGRPIG